MTLPTLARIVGARELKVGLLRSPDYASDADIAEALATHFECERLVCSGDVFPLPGGVCVRVEEAWAVQSGQSLDDIWAAAEEETSAQIYAASSRLTRLYQVSEVNGHRAVPLDWELFLDPPPPFDALLSRLSRAAAGCANLGCATFLRQLMVILWKCSCDFGSPATFLVCGGSGSGKGAVAAALASRLSTPVLHLDVLALPADAPAATEARLKLHFERAVSSSPVLILLRNVELLGLDASSGESDARVVGCLEELIRSLSEAALPVVVLATAEALRRVPPPIAALFLFHETIPNLGVSERRGILERLLPEAPPDALEEAATRASGLVLADLASIAIDAAAEDDGDSADGILAALDRLQSAFGEAIGAAKIPRVSWSSVGGLEDAKATLLEAVRLSRGGGGQLRRSGLLLHGPPGCGKTLLAKAVATECRLSFVSVKGPELLNMYVGQSEENVRQVFEEAAAAAPCVVFFDELDALAPSRGKAGDSGGVMDRVVSSLLGEMDGLGPSVFVIGATNRPDLVEPSLLRPGRFDKLIYVGLSGDRGSQAAVLRAQTAPLAMDWEGAGPDDLVQHLPTDVSGADIYGIVAAAAGEAFAAAVLSAQAEGRKDAEERIVIRYSDLLAAIPATPKSL